MTATFPPVTTLTGTITDASGLPVSGTVTAVPVALRGTQALPVAVTDASGFVVVAPAGVRRRFDASSGGSFSMPLAATDTAGLAPSGWAYQFTLDAGQAGTTETFTALLPGSPTTLDFSALVPAVPGTALNAYVPLTGGTLSGTLTLGGSPPLLIPGAGIILTAPAPSGDATGATDSANLQAAITSVGNTSAMRAVRIYLAPGNYIINATLLAQKKSIELIGCGWGSGSGTGIGTSITWAGSAATPMLRLWDCFGSKVSRIKFLNGAAAAQPSAAISMYNLSGDTNGSSFNLIEQCWFGPLEGFDSTPANQLACGVLFEGDNVNDDQSTISGCVFYACDTGVKLSNTQNVVNKIEHSYFYGCGVGVNTGASVSLDHTFMGSTTGQDLNISNGAIVTCTNFSAEASAQLAYIRGGSQLLVKGGYWQIRNALTGSSGSAANVVDALENSSQSVKFEDYRFVFFGYTNPATPQIAIGQVTGGSGTVQLALENCSGITDTPSTTAVYPFLQSGGNTGCHLLLEGSVNGAGETNAKQRFRTALDEVNVGFTYSLPVSFATYNVPGGVAIGTQTAYARVLNSNISQALTASTWTLISGAPAITLPNDGNTYRIELTCPGSTLSTAQIAHVAFGPSVSVMYGDCQTDYFAAGQSNGALNVVAQKVTGSGQTVSVYGLCTQAYTLTLLAGVSGLIELAAYRVA